MVSVRPQNEKIIYSIICFEYIRNKLALFMQKIYSVTFKNFENPRQNFGSIKIRVR